jgi:tetratricopeptide (TPR) repeat protein
MLEDIAWATALLEEALTKQRELGNSEWIGWALVRLGRAAQLQGEYDRARQLHEERLPLFRKISPRFFGIVDANQSLGETALAQGNAALAKMHFGQALTLARDQEYRIYLAWCLAGLAGTAMLNEEPERAARLWGAAEALRQSIGSRPAPAARATRERLMAAALEQLGETAFAAAWAKGQAMKSEQAIELALAAERATTGATLPAAAGG